MTYTEIKKEALKLYRPVLSLDAAFPPKERKILNAVLDGVLGVSGVFAIFLFVTAKFSFASALPAVGELTAALLPFLEKIYGVFFLAASLRLSTAVLGAFRASSYFKDISSILQEDGGNGTIRVSYEVGTVIAGTSDRDITEGFISSFYGTLILARCGIGKDARESFVAGKRTPLSADAFSLPDEGKSTLEEYARALFESDSDFKQFLFSNELQEKQFIAAARWVRRTYEEKRKKERFWSRDNLGRVPGIGKDWSYGQTYIIRRYGNDIRKSPFYSSVNTKALGGAEEVEALETILSRAEEANAFLVGEEGVGKLEIVARLARKIYEGTVLSPIEHKQVIVFDGAALVANMKEKSAFESELLRVFNQAVKAGNIILVLSNFPAFLRSASSIGSDIVTLLGPYFTLRELQIIATSDPDSYHQSLEPNMALMRRFQTVLVKTSDETAVVRLLENAALAYEAREGVFFTYPSLEAIARSADQYITTGVMPDKAIDLLIEVISSVKRKKKTVVTKEDVLDYVQEKTGIPVGRVTSDEKEKLLNLEAEIHQRVIGQDEAVSGIANAMRRSRAGVGATDRPIGSFLFLGPTGVGKTQTAKTLAKIFFGSEKNMTRLDMSEYQTDDALERLIGYYETGKPGVFTSILREKPHGVLLLDEFEKTNKDVHDLFLQILDEGIFSDMAGKRVNARNLIIIATSNAASDLIWKYFRAGDNPANHTDELIDAIIERGIYAPELLNRFDGVIIFHPLEKEHIRAIAQIMLSELANRLKEQGIALVINDALLDVLADVGYDPEFGARPMERAIQEKVEQVIARKKIKGDIKTGDTVELSKEDLRGE